MVVSPPPPPLDQAELCQARWILVRRAVPSKMYRNIFKLLLLLYNHRGRQCAGISPGHAGFCRPESLQHYPFLFNASADTCYATALNAHTTNSAFEAEGKPRHFSPLLLKWCCYCDKAVLLIFCLHGPLKVV